MNTKFVFSLIFSSKWTPDPEQKMLFGPGGCGCEVLVKVKLEMKYVC